MGEARRRKALDPNYGKSAPPTVSITRSTLTENYLVMINDFCFEEATEYEDALKVKGELEELLVKHPIRGIVNEQTIMDWCLLYQHLTSDVDAVVMKTTSGSFFGTAPPKPVSFNRYSDMINSKQANRRNN